MTRWKSVIEKSKNMQKSLETCVDYTPWVQIVFLTVMVSLWKPIVIDVNASYRCEIDDSQTYISGLFLPVLTLLPKEICLQQILFLDADTRLYTLLCRSVGR